MRDKRYRWLLRLLPASFREDHEAEILRVWRDELRDAGDRHRTGLWWRAMIDTLKVAPGEHASACGRNVLVAVRRLRRAPAFTLTAVLTLAVATGATAAVFSLVNAVLLRPLPWRTPETVGLIWAVQPSGARTWLSFPELDELQREGSFAAVAGFTDLRPTLVADGVGQELQVLAVSHGLFELLGATPHLGRAFKIEDDRSGAAPVAVLSHAFWQRQFGADPTIIGRSLTLDDRVYSVVGVLPEGFSILPPSSVLPSRVDLWVALEPHLISRDRTVRFLHAVARLRPDTGYGAAASTLHAYAARVRADFAASYPHGSWDFTVVSFADDVLARVRVPMYLLFGLVSLVLIMGCANVANLLLVRGEARRAELAIRTALGASTARLAGELLAEALVLATAGGVLGLLLAGAAPALLRHMNPGALPRLDQVGVDARVLCFMLALVLLTVVLFASLPLLERLRSGVPGLVATSRGGGRTLRSARIGSSLLVIQMALATMIVITTLSLGDTFVDLQQVNLGITPGHIITGRVSLSSKYGSGAAAASFFERLLAAAEGAPGVRQAAAITQLPLSGAMLGSTFLFGPAAAPQRIDADLRGVTRHYFEVIGTSLIRGRPFAAQDSSDSPPVAIIDESFARRLSADGNALGARIRWIRQPAVELEVVGIVQSVRHRGPSEPVRDTVYRPHQQYSRPAMFLALKTDHDTASAASVLRNVVSSIDGAQPVSDVATMDQRVEHALSGARTSLMLAGVLTVIALTLGGVGVYGVLSFSVAQRMRELGVRSALGAEPATLRTLICREGLTLTLKGAAFGTMGAAILGRALGAALFVGTGTGVRPYTFGLLLVLVSSAFAFWLPARRAAGVSPSAVLRAD